jgi:hypothetical protein
MELSFRSLFVVTLAMQTVGLIPILILMRLVPKEERKAKKDVVVDANLSESDTSFTDDEISQKIKLITKA